MKKNTGKYYNRDLSWLSFNYLVLKQIQDTDLPIYERIKFLAIYSSNLEEFYKVRVTSYRSLVNMYKESENVKSEDAQQVLDRINEEVTGQYAEYENVFYNEIIPELEKNGICLFQGNELNKIHEEFLDTYFYQEVLPFIQPVILSRSGNVLSFLQDNVIYLAIKMYKKKSKNNRPYYAVVKNPTDHLPRFVESEQKLSGKFLIFFLEDILKMRLHLIFPGYIIESVHPIKVSRNADFNIDDEFSGNLLEKIRNHINQRKTGFPARFMYEQNLPEDLLNVLQMAFNIEDVDYIETSSVLNFQDFFDFPNPLGDKLRLKPLKRLHHKTPDKYDSVFDAVKKQDILLHFPYHSYDYVLRFFNQAAIDPIVEEIKTTQYRVATNSAVVNALITAARNNKKVTVFVELKARFDEKLNMKFAYQMRDAGINVIASIPGLKVHAKAALVIRKPKKKKDRKAFAFFSTGNFNEKTAKQYSDLGFFTSDKRLTNELKSMFSYLESPMRNFKFEHILVPRFNFMPRINELIDYEIEQVQQRKKGRIILKMNGLQEKAIIDKLYEAGQAGVETQLLVRGICCLRTGRDFSKNISVIRIVDRFLEHARIYAFEHTGDWQIYFSTADLMNRNIHRRVEIAVPVFDKNLKKEILKFLEIQLSDNCKAKTLDYNINNIDIPQEGNNKRKAQQDFYNYLRNIEENS
ncbi:MAG: polyphosphate kinase 1 [Bacteroidota bacterium]|nr:polyphosphate kinase 1 [Bacteroidota bacterium]